MRKTNRNRAAIVLAATTAAGMLVTRAAAQVAYTGDGYSQNFDTLPNTPENTSLQATIPWTDNSTSSATQTSLPAWYLFHSLSNAEGNRHYPHMKLAIERSPDGQGYLYRPDTHDGHCCPPVGHPEHGAFRQMMERNLELTTRIETALTNQGLPTFKSYLQHDLARRQAARGDHMHVPPSPIDQTSTNAPGSTGA